MADQKKTLFDYTEGNAPALTDLCLTGEDPAGTKVMRRLTWQTIRNLFVGAPTADGDMIVGNSTGTWSKYTLAATKVLLGLDILSCQGRLTLESGVPVSTSDQADKTTLYFTPFHGDKIALYDGSNWIVYSFSEISLNISAYTASKPYDIFAYNNSGNVAIEGLVWTNGTTRATALTTQNGVYVKTGDTTRRYIGTIYMDAASKCQDTIGKRYCWNYYNRVSKKLNTPFYNGTHTYTTASYRAFNSNTTIGEARVEFVIGVVEDIFNMAGWGELVGTGSGQQAIVGFGLNSTSAALGVATKIIFGGNMTSDVSFLSSGYPENGLNYVNVIEYGAATSASYNYISTSGELRG